MPAFFKLGFCLRRLSTSFVIWSSFRSATSWAVFETTTRWFTTFFAPSTFIAAASAACLASSVATFPRRVITPSLVVTRTPVLLIFSSAKRASLVFRVIQESLSSFPALFVVSFVFCVAVVAASFAFSVAVVAVSFILSVIDWSAACAIAGTRLSATISRAGSIRRSIACSSSSFVLFNAEVQRICHICRLFRLARQGRVAALVTRLACEISGVHEAPRDLLTVAFPDLYRAIIPISGHLALAHHGTFLDNDLLPHHA